MRDNSDVIRDFKLLINDSSDAKKKKKKSHKHEKRKSEGEVNGDASIPKSAKRNKTKEGTGSGLEPKINCDVVQVVAAPEQLLPLPSIFKKRNKEQLKNPSVSNFIKSKVNYDVVNSERFSNSLQLVSPEMMKASFPESPKRSSRAEMRDVSVLTDEIIPGKQASPKKTDHKEEVSSPETKKRKDAVIHAYQVPHKNAFILLIQHPSEFSFMGKVKLTLLAGCLEIFGSSLDSASSIDLFSPKSCTSPVIETLIPNNDLNIEELESILLNSNLITKSDMKKLLNEIKPYDSVILIEELNSNLVRVFEKYSDKTLFSELPLAASSLPELAQSLHCVFNLNNSNFNKEFRKNPQWEEMDLGKCNFVVGGKNVGKSSLIKYLINRNLPECGAVLCLDLDPGQPEFCPPGCLAATVVRKPVIGPNFTQCIEPEKMVCFGEINVSQHPTAYLEAVKFIVDYYRNDPVLLQMPCFVNTMGFSKGMGVALTVSVMRLLRPDNVIQITSSDNRNNFPYHFTPECLTFSEGQLFNIPDTSDFCYDFNLIESYSEEDGVSLVGTLKPRELRDLKLLSYFSQMITPEQPDFNSVQPYSIPFCKLYLAVHGAIAPNEILKAFNGNMVALCQHKQDLSSEFLEPSEKDYFRILTKPKAMPCFGLGFVRGVDVVGKKIYIITHLPSFIMESVNCLMLGFVSPPHSVYLKQDTVEGQIPYTSINSGDNVQMVKRAYKYPTNHTPENA